MIKRVILNARQFCSTVTSSVVINGKEYPKDIHYNVSPKILTHLNKNLHSGKDHPISFVSKRIIQYFYDNFKGKTGNPLFSVYNDLNPIVTTKQNFDSLLVPESHPSRAKTDSYYINSETLFRGHMTAHQSELISMGLNNFLMLGDVYRRDDINSTHYPVFHQLDGVRLRTPQELYSEMDDGQSNLEIIEKNPDKQVRTNEKQELYKLEASKLTERELKNTLEGLTKKLFGKDINFKWVDAYFPFTHPSWELEIEVAGSWMEVLGCGVMEHKLLKHAGCEERIGWAFGLGLERLAMILYQIPDIRVFWSEDNGFTSQFAGKSYLEDIKFKSISHYAPLINDLSFWTSDTYMSSDFHDLVREVGGDLVESVSLIDEFKHPKTGKVSHCYRIVYRHMDKTLTQEEVTLVHSKITQEAAGRLRVEPRIGNSTASRGRPSVPNGSAGGSRPRTPTGAISPAGGSSDLFQRNGFSITTF